MKFLVDVNASGVIAELLTMLGHDVVQVALHDERMPDETILSWAVREQRIIVTTDQDFETMIWREGKRHCGVLRLENLPRLARKALLEDILEQYSHELVLESIIIATSRKTRIRRQIGGD